MLPASEGPPVTSVTRRDTTARKGWPSRCFGSLAFASFIVSPSEKATHYPWTLAGRYGPRPPSIARHW